MKTLIIPTKTSLNILVTVYYILKNTKQTHKTRNSYLLLRQRNHRHHLQDLMASPLCSWTWTWRNSIVYSSFYENQVYRNAKMPTPSSRVHCRYLYLNSLTNLPFLKNDYTKSEYALNSERFGCLILILCEMFGIIGGIRSINNTVS